MSRHCRQACDGGKKQLRSISLVGDKHLVGTSTIIIIIVDVPTRCLYN